MSLHRDVRGWLDTITLWLLGSCGLLLAWFVRLTSALFIGQMVWLWRGCRLLLLHGHVVYFDIPVYIDSSHFFLACDDAKLATWRNSVKTASYISIHLYSSECLDLAHFHAREKVLLGNGKSEEKKRELRTHKVKTNRMNCSVEIEPPKRREGRLNLHVLRVAQAEGVTCELVYAPHKLYFPVVPEMNVIWGVLRVHSRCNNEN